MSAIFRRALFTLALTAATEVSAQEPCRPFVDRVAVRFENSESSIPKSHDMRHQDTQDARLTVNRDLTFGSDTWTSPEPFDPVHIRKLDGFLPRVGRCLGFEPTASPQAERLSDGQCYGLFEFRVIAKCWALRVESEPYDYPFLVVGDLDREPRRFRAGDLDWNLEKELLRDRELKVEIFDRGTSAPAPPLLAVEGVTFVNLWKRARLLRGEELAELVVQSRLGCLRDTECGTDELSVLVASKRSTPPSSSDPGTRTHADLVQKVDQYLLAADRKSAEEAIAPRLELSCLALAAEGGSSATCSPDEPRREAE